MKNLTLETNINNFWPDPWKYNDAGRGKSKWHGTADCGVRAFAICCNMSYDKSRKYLKKFTKIGKANNRRISNGIFTDDMNLAMESQGWFYTKTTKTGGLSFYYDMPKDVTLLCNMPKHFVAMQNGIILDTFNSSGRHIVGYWMELQS